MKINRRKFLKNLAYSGLEVITASNLLKCTKKNPVTSDSNNPAGDGSNYVPLVDHPFINRPFSGDIKDPAPNGEVNFYSEGNLYTLILQNQNGKPVTTPHVHLYEESIKKNKVFSVRTIFRSDLPTIHTISPLKKTISGNQTDTITVYNVGEELFGQGKDFVVKEIKKGLPSWNKEHINSLPTFLYIGDWSFNNLKQLNTNIKYSSALIGIINLAAGLNVYAVTTKVGAVMDSIDGVIDEINNNTSIKIDKNKQYPFYQSLLIPQLIVAVPPEWVDKTSDVDIKYLYPTDIGNKWSYKSGNNTVTREVVGTKNIRGKNLLVIKNTDGIEEYLGFYKDALYSYGFKEKTLDITILANPAIKIGDKVNKGKVYNTTSKIICEEYPKITGTVSEKIVYEDRVQLVIDNRPYGDCFKVRDETSVTISGEGKSVSESGTSIQYSLKDVGMLKKVADGKTIEISDFVLGVPSQLNKNPEVTSYNSNDNLSYTGIVSRAFKNYLNQKL